MGGVGLVDRVLSERGGQPECFLCGKCILQRSQLLLFRKSFSAGTVGMPGSGGLAPEAPVHAECLNGRNPVDVAASYHRWVADQADISRAALGPIIGRA